MTVYCVLHTVAFQTVDSLCGVFRHRAHAEADRDFRNARWCGDVKYYHVEEYEVLEAPEGMP